MTSNVARVTFRILRPSAHRVTEAGDISHPRRSGDVAYRHRPQRPRNLVPAGLSPPDSAPPSRSTWDLRSSRLSMEASPVSPPNAFPLRRTRRLVSSPQCCTEGPRPSRPTNPTDRIRKPGSAMDKGAGSWDTAADMIPTLDLATRYPVASCPAAVPISSGHVRGW